MIILRISAVPGADIPKLLIEVMPGETAYPGSSRTAMDLDGICATFVPISPQKRISGSRLAAGGRFPSPDLVCQSRQ